MGRPAAITGLILALLLAAAPARAADDDATTGPAESEPATSSADLQGLIERIQGRLSKLNQDAGASGAALDFLQNQVDQAIDRLDGRQDENEALRDDAKELRGNLDTLEKEGQGLRDNLADSLRELAELQAEVTRLTALLQQEKQAAAAELEAAKAERDRVVAELEKQVADLSSMLLVEREGREAFGEELAALREENSEAGRELRVTLAEMRRLRAELDEAESNVATLAGERDELQARADETSAAAEIAQAKVDTLNWQLNELRQQLETLNEVLEASEARNKDQQDVIFALEKRLNKALAAKALELARYRSEFFGRLREALGDRDDIAIIGDRFVFQSEVLFASGEAQLGPAGRRQMTQFSDTLQEVAREIPTDINWILRVDGHTDSRPIRNDRFPSNWELSTARATEVVRFLIRQGVAPNRLMAAGLGEFHPIAEGTTRDELRRNRRIEFRLTQQ